MQLSPCVVFIIVRNRLFDIIGPALHYLNLGVLVGWFLYVPQGYGKNATNHHKNAHVPTLS